MDKSDANFESLVDQRTFLLQSLRDLDAEFKAGDLDLDDYNSLRSDYVARTAQVLKELESPEPTSSIRENTKSTKRARQTVITLLLVLIVATGTGWLVAKQSGQRLSGQS